jgi:hypothetical protein
MSVITISEVFQGPALPAGVTIAQVVATVTDSSGATQTVTLNGSETPTPWTSASLTVAAGAGSVSSVATDSAGTAYPAIVQAFNTTSTTAALQLSGTTVTIVTP